MLNIIDILKSEKTRKAIRKVWDDTFTNPEDRPPFTVENAADYYSGNFINSTKHDHWSSRQGIFGDPRDQQFLEGVLQIYVLDKLALPSIITIDELYDIVSKCLYVPVEMLDVGYMNLIMRVSQSINHNSGEPQEVHRGTLVLNNNEELLLWHKGAIRAYLSSMKISSDTFGEFGSIESPFGFVSFLEYSLRFRLEMISSNQMFLNTQQELTQLINSLLITFKDMYTMKYLYNKEERVLAISNDENQFKPYFNHISTCLDIFYSTSGSGKGKFLVDRIRNSMILLIQADAVNNPAIKDALSMTAVEALACTKGTEISKTMAENVAILLDPDLKYRKQIQKEVKRLYDFRSRVLHGDVVEKSPSSITFANCEDIFPRSLASAVLLAALERMEFFRRVEDKPETFSDFIAEIQDEQYKARSPLGVLESPLFEIRRIYGDI